MSAAVARPGEAGLTLLELLVAITLLGLLMAALFGGLQLGGRAWERSEQRLDHASRLQVVHDFLRDRLVQAYPLRSADEPDGAEVTFEGSADRVRFITLMPEHLGTGFAEFVVGIDGDLDARHLVVQWRPYDPSAERADAGDPQVKVLLEGIEALRLSYYGAPDRRAASRWFEAWRGGREIPDLVRVEIEFPLGDPRRWPDLVIRPMVDAIPESL